jgi:hypothetical protein
MARADLDNSQRDPTLQSRVILLGIVMDVFEQIVVCKRQYPCASLRVRAGRVTTWMRCFVRFRKPPAAPTTKQVSTAALRIEVA